MRALRNRQLRRRMRRSLREKLDAFLHFWRWCGRGCVPQEASSSTLWLRCGSNCRQLKSNCLAYHTAHNGRPEWHLCVNTCCCFGRLGQNLLLYHPSEFRGADEDDSDMGNRPRPSPSAACCVDTYGRVCGCAWCGLRPGSDEHYALSMTWLCGGLMCSLVSFICCCEALPGGEAFATIEACRSHLEVGSGGGGTVSSGNCPGGTTQVVLPHGSGLWHRVPICNWALALAWCDPALEPMPSTDEVIAALAEGGAASGAAPDASGLHAHNMPTLEPRLPTEAMMLDGLSSGFCGCDSQSLLTAAHHLRTAAIARYALAAVGCARAGCCVFGSLIAVLAAEQAARSVREAASSNYGPRGNMARVAAAARRRRRQQAEARLQDHAQQVPVQPVVQQVEQAPTQVEMTNTTRGPQVEMMTTTPTTHARSTDVHAPSTSLLTTQGRVVERQTEAATPADVDASSSATRSSAYAGTSTTQEASPTLREPLLAPI
ncbi:unnamed protein product [Amoebophrya sp. A25]|nr:unnamed protein product [Amoebophrya sp. A25]|eukprot:GSA25T00015347001.1